MASRLNSPADIARMALKRLAELGLAPTPQNYTKFYNEIAGIAPAVKEEAEQSNVQLVANVQHVVQEAADTTGGLADLIRDHNDDIKSSIHSLQNTQDTPEMMRLLQAIVHTATNMHDTVEDSHDSLRELTASLNQMRDDLAASRHALERDPLTGTQNRQGLDMLLNREVQRCRTYQAKLSVALIDLDFFKQINDRFGHHVGDKVLIHVSNITKAVLRGNDVLVRYGGEEFLILLPETDLHGAKYLLERLRLVFRNNAVMHEGKRIDISFSAGLAQLAADENGHALILRADQALYAAKNAGRNTIIAAPEHVADR
ncbi:diguanylate cyclase [Chitinivorax tropicus]|uniref:diguanylate cyclase n=1 Tax=Chitinivorax tropicus TaxID=714531 RepID=A0A840MPH9_9PROT|nr:GGDEF domain-containing protein [Chitinivorax tropicus]MBB5017151.1 diguanylate cyclase [Chitinivorax tropicus]